jgi:hypothetical protein
MTALQDQLDEITANTRTLVQPERLAVGERAVEELFATGIEDRILPAGAQAPEFALRDPNGSSCAVPTSWRLGHWSSSFFAGAGAPTA